MKMSFLDSLLGERPQRPSLRPRLNCLGSLEPVVTINELNFMKTTKSLALVLGTVLAIGAGTFLFNNTATTEKTQDTLKDAGQKTSDALKDAADKTKDAVNKA